jgi:hypothetical protein
MEEIRSISADLYRNHAAQACLNTGHFGYDDEVLGCRRRKSNLIIARSFTHTSSDSNDLRTAIDMIGSPQRRAGMRCNSLLFRPCDRRTLVVAARHHLPGTGWAGHSMYGSPVIGAPGSVVATNTGNAASNELIDFDIATSSIRWHVPGPFRGNPAYQAGVFYALTGSPKCSPSLVPVALEARSEADGSLLWSWAAPASDVIQSQSDVLLTNSLVFVSTDSATYAIDLTTHQVAWTLDYPGRLAISDRGVLYFSLTDPLIPQNGWVAAINFK